MEDGGKTARGSIEMEEEKRRILIAEDDGDIIQVLKMYLSNAGFELLTARNGMAAYQIFCKEKVDAGIFDIMMPRMDGYHLIKKVRETSNIPIIVLSAKKEDTDKIFGLDIGADDYITKPFNPLEVVARVKAVLRRFYDLNPTPPVDEEKTQLVFENIRIDKLNHQLYKDGKEIYTTPAELSILILLMENRGRVFTKIQIYEYLNGNYCPSDEKSITVHISNIRNKIEEDKKNPRFIVTVRGLGYRFCGDDLKDDDDEKDE